MCDKKDEIFEIEEPKVKVVKEKKPISTERLEKLRSQLIKAREVRLAKKNKNKDEVAVKEEVVKDEVVKEEPIKKNVIKKEALPKKKRINKADMLQTELNALKLEVNEMKSKNAVAKTTPAKKDAPLPVVKTAPISIPKPSQVLAYKPIPYSLFKAPMW